MSLNLATLSPARQPTPLPNELTIRTIDSGVELSLHIPDAPPTGPATSGGSGGSKKLKETGRIWLTDQRLIFVADLPSKGAPSFQSLSVPLSSLLSTKFEQPRFGANYLSIDIRPSFGGGLVDGTRAEIRFKDKGLFEFTTSLEKTRERAIYMKRQSAEEEEGLPAYSTPGPSGASSPYVPGDIPSENPPGYDD
ncbi:hypothetical protein C8Q77DRAFT_1091701 [Trametes polyzona]|nr:hypothetical protein C8Q77DRAFT_1091701 [Trametes polyzona]